jgi:hypothetical protein
MTVVPVCLWLPRLLPGVGACFDFMGASERLSCIGTAHRKHMSGVRELEGTIRGMLVEFSPARCTSIQIVVTLGYE